MKRKVLNLILFVITITIVLAGICIHYVLPNIILKPQRVNVEIMPNDLNLTSEKITVKGYNDITIKGYWNKTELKPKGLIIILHGIGSCKEHNLYLAKKLSNQGYECIVFDGRAHGKSGGTYSTYGYYENKDVSKIIDFIKMRNPKIKIGLWGISQGGAIALQTLAIDKRINFGVIESTFTELNLIVYDYMNKIFGIKWIAEYALKRAGEIANFEPNKVKPILSVTKIDQPVIIAHGDQDENISINYGKELFKDLKSKKKELIIVENAGHFDLHEKGGEEFFNKIIKFINW